MKHVLLLSLCCTLLFSACGQRQSPPASSAISAVEPSASSPLSAVETEKTELTIARLGEADGEITAAVTAFNDYSQEYHITDRFYEKENGELQLRMDILSGDAPDILPMREINSAIYSKGGLLEDLSPYLDQESFLKEDIMPNLLEAVRDTDGGLFQLPVSFQLCCAYVPTLLAQDGHWTTDTFLTYISEYPDQGIMSGLSPWQKTQTFLAYDLSRFVDYGAGEARFDSQEFYDYLGMMKEVCNRQASGAPLLQGASFNTLSQYKSFLSDTEGYYTLTGYPTDQGNGVLADVSLSFGILQSAENRDGAWAFLRFLLSEDFQRQCFSFPVRSSVMEERLKESEDGFPNSSGMDLDPKQVLQIAGGPAGTNIPSTTASAVDGLTSEEADAFLALTAQIDMVKSKSAKNTEQISIIYEEAASYFSGGKTAQEAAEIIQSRFAIYFSEQS